MIASTQTEDITMADTWIKPQAKWNWRCTVPWLPKLPVSSAWSLDVYFISTQNTTCNRGNSIMRRIKTCNEAIIYWANTILTSRRGGLLLFHNGIIQYVRPPPTSRRDIYTQPVTMATQLHPLGKDVYQGNNIIREGTMLCVCCLGNRFWILFFWFTSYNSRQKPVPKYFSLCSNMRELLGNYTGNFGE